MCKDIVKVGVYYKTARDDATVRTLSWKAIRIPATDLPASITKSGTIDDSFDIPISGASDRPTLGLMAVLNNGAQTQSVTVPSPAAVVEKEVKPVTWPVKFGTHD